MKVIGQVISENFSAYCGDSSEILPGIPSESIDMSIYSPPFLICLFIQIPSVA